MVNCTLSWWPRFTPQQLVVFFRPLASGTTHIHIALTVYCISLLLLCIQSPQLKHKMFSFFVKFFFSTHKMQHFKMEINPVS